MEGRFCNLAHTKHRNGQLVNRNELDKTAGKLLLKTPVRAMKKLLLAAALSQG